MQNQTQISRSNSANYQTEELNLIHLFPDVSQEIRLNSLKFKNRNPKRHEFTDISKESRPAAAKPASYFDQIARKKRKSFHTEMSPQGHSSMRLMKVLLIFAALAFLAFAFFGIFYIPV